MNLTILMVYFLLFFALYFEVFLLVNYVFETISNKKIQNNYLSDKNNLYPSVTIIVPAWNEEKTIRKTLESLINLNYPNDKLSIIVVDDGSTDNTFNVAKSIKNSKITVLKKKNGGKHSALNYAMQFVNSEIVGSLDADSFVEKNSLQLLIAHFKNPEIAAVTAGIKANNTKGFLQSIQKTEYDMLIFIRKAFSLADSLFITPGPFSLFRKSILDKIGYWKHAHMTEDLEMGLRLQKNNYKIANEPKAIVYTNVPESPVALYKQRERWAYGFINNIFENKNLLLNPKYGNLGILILPMAMLSSGLILFWSIASIFTLLDNLINLLTKAFIAGFDFSFSFGIFSISLSVGVIILMIIITIYMVSLMIGKRLSKDKELNLTGLVLYLIFYRFFVPIWITSAYFKVFTKKKSKWR